MLRILALLLTSLLAASMLVGCGHDDVEVVEEDVPVNFLWANPPSRAVIGPKTTITLTFDGMPINITSSNGKVTVSKETAVISGPFAGPYGKMVEWTITWKDGTQKLLYYIAVVCADEGDPCG